MARGKKKESLTPEERLQAALVPESEKPYKIPRNWCWTYLTKGAAECLDSFRKPINASERANREGDIPYYGATGQVGWIDDFLTNEQLVLVGEDGAPFLDLIKDKAYIIEGKAWVNNHAHILRSHFGNTGNLFLMHYLNIFNYHDFVNGTTRLKLTQGSMDTMPVPIPPLPEQQRIVDRIESLFAKLDEAKQKVQEALDSFETRKAAILHKAFTGELTAQWRKEHGVEMESWESLELGKIIKVSSGKMLTAKNMNRNGNIPVYGGNGITGVHNIANVPANTIVIGRVGFYCGSVHYVEEPAWVTDNALIVGFNSEEINTKFLYYLLSHTDLRKNESSTAQPVISGSKIYPIVVRRSKHIKEQTEIVHILDDLLAKEQQAKEAAEGVLEQIDLIKKAILARAFRGELGTNDPCEENAAELLCSWD